MSRKMPQRLGDPMKRRIGREELIDHVENEKEPHTDVDGGAFCLSNLAKKARHFNKNLLIRCLVTFKYYGVIFIFVLTGILLSFNLLKYSTDNFTCKNGTCLRIFPASANNLIKIYPGNDIDNRHETISNETLVSYKYEMALIKNELKEVYKAMLDIVYIINKGITTKNSLMHSKETPVNDKIHLNEPSPSANDSGIAELNSQVSRLDNRLNDVYQKHIDKTESLQKMVEKLDIVISDLGNVVTDTKFSVNEITHKNINANITNSIKEYTDKIVHSVGSVVDDLKHLKANINSILPRLSKLESSQQEYALKNENRYTLDVQNIIEKVTNMVESDFVKEPDYVFYDSGGTVIDKLTSKTFDKYTQYTSGTYGPETVIKSGTLPGQCWSMKNYTGVITLQSRVPIIPTSVTIDHTLVNLFSENGIFPTAPKDIVFWAIYDLKLFTQILIESSQSKDIATFPQASESLSDVLVDTKSGNIVAIRLAKIVFDPTVNNRSTYKINYSDGIKSQLGLNLEYSNTELPSTKHFSFFIHSNWGKKEYTCIYRMRVHGKIGLY